MKKILSILLAISLFFSMFGFAQATVHVNGYFRKNGTYVAPYIRTSPNSTKTDNYSYPGNYNPNTGKITSGGYSSNDSIITIPVPLSCPAGSTLIGSTCYSCPSGYLVSSDLTCVPTTSSTLIPASAVQTPEAQLNFLKSQIAELQRQINLLLAQLAAIKK